jgi:hypothetical protein
MQKLSSKAGIIIGIHGLALKPLKPVLTRYWKQAIFEGLHTTFGWPQKQNIPFEMVHWASILHKEFLQRSKSPKQAKNHNREPYIPSIPGTILPYGEKREVPFSHGIHYKTRRTLGRLFDQVPLGKAVDFILEHTASDLSIYQDPNEVRIDSRGKAQPVNDLLQNELKRVLWKHRKKRICLVAHSMGSIIAYDVLHEISNDAHWLSNLRIETFITIGSPLAFQKVRSHFYPSKPEGRPSLPISTPEIISNQWLNFRDPLDHVALDTPLNEIFHSNLYGVHVQDELVWNNYLNEEGDPNFHKSYGYLRSPEISHQLFNFLTNIIH